MYVPLHLHTQYSILDGLVSIEGLKKKAEKLGLPAVAITEHGNLFSAYKFYQEFKSSTVKPILGMEAYISRDLESKDISHITLLCENQQGWLNLVKLSSLAYSEKYFYKKPRITLELLEKHKNGLIILSGCLATLLHTGDGNVDRPLLDWFASTFGKDYFYIELQRLGLEIQDLLTGNLIQAAQETGLSCVITNDVHWLNKEDKKAHEILLCLKTKSTLLDEDRFNMDTEKCHLQAPEEIEETWKDHPEFVANTVKIAERCNCKLDYKGYLFPKHLDCYGNSIDSLKWLKETALKSLEEQVPENKKDIYIKRLEYEMSVIEKMEFASYFAAVSDYVQWAKKNKIRVGPGRGSGAGSLIFYLLGVTDVDPVKYNLIFERFLNPSRVSLPDLDCDFEDRDSVIEYCIKKHSPEKVLHINVFKPFAAKGAIRGVARVLNIPLNEADMIAKAIPDSNRGINFDLDRLELLPKDHDIFIYYNDSKYKDLFKYAKTFDGVITSLSVHPSGIIVSPIPITDIVPTYTLNVGLENQEGIKYEKRVTSCQWDMGDLEAAGLVKFDILGLDSLRVISKTEEFIKKNDSTFIIESICENDGETYDNLGTGDMLGIFQLEGSQLFSEICARTKPRCIENISEIVSIVRPGPIDSGLHHEYIRAKETNDINILFHIPENPQVQEQVIRILEKTQGLLIYQEQLMEISKAVACYTMAESDTLRKHVGKKKINELRLERKKFVDQAKLNRITEKTSNEIFDAIEKFGLYGFNKSHAMSYSLITYIMAYLKTHYPAEFMAALFYVKGKDNSEKSRSYIPKYLTWCKKNGIDVLAPNVNVSDSDFRIKDKKIFYGLSCIKGASKVACDSIINEREKQGKYTDIYELSGRLYSCKELTARTLNVLAQAGALNEFPHTRKEHIEYAIDDALFNRDVENPWWYRVKLGEYSNLDLLSLEKSLVGTYFSGHPLDEFSEIDKAGYSSIERVLEEGLESFNSEFLFLITAVKEITIKNGRNAGQLMAILTVEDLTGTADVVLFSDKWTRIKDTIEAGAVYYIEGQCRFKEFAEERTLSIYPRKIEKRIPTKPIRRGSFKVETLSDLDFLNETGEDKVNIYYLIDKYKYLLNKELKINLNKLKSIFGKRVC